MATRRPGGTGRRGGGAKRTGAQPAGRPGFAPRAARGTATHGGKTLLHRARSGGIRTATGD